MTKSKAKPRQLSSTSSKALSKLIEASKSWGWQSDQGYDGKEISRSARVFDESEAAMKKRLLYLERTVYALRKKINGPPSVYDDMKVGK